MTGLVLELTVVCICAVVTCGCLDCTIVRCGFSKTVDLCHESVTKLCLPLCRSATFDAEKCEAMLAQGKRDLMCGEVPQAVNQLQEVCRLLYVNFLYETTYCIIMIIAHSECVDYGTINFKRTELYHSGCAVTMKCAQKLCCMIRGEWQFRLVRRYWCYYYYYYYYRKKRFRWRNV